MVGAFCTLSQNQDNSPPFKKPTKRRFLWKQKSISFSIPSSEHYDHRKLKQNNETESSLILRISKRVLMQSSLDLVLFCLLVTVWSRVGWVTMTQSSTSVSNMHHHPTN